MNVRILGLAAGLLVACGGGEVAGSNASGDASAADGLGADASSLTMTTGVLGEWTTPGSDCAPSHQELTIDLANGAFTLRDCEPNVEAVAAVDAGANDQPVRTLVVKTQKSLTDAELGSVRAKLAGYHTTAPQPKNECGYDGTAFELQLTTAQGTTTRYWDQAYNCNYPDDVAFVSPSLRTLFESLAGS